MHNYIAKPKKPIFRSVLLILLTVGVLGMQGCVYLRLLEVKNQLKEFDQNFSVTVQDESLTVHFLDPALYSDDIYYLSKVYPSYAYQIGAKHYWKYIFEKLKPDNQTLEDGKEMMFTMIFTEEERLNQFHFSQIFLEFVPPEFIELSLRALGDAKVDKLNRKVDADTSVWKNQQLSAPQLSTIQDSLGTPLNESIEKDEVVLTYHYLLLTTQGNASKEDRIAETTLRFDKESEALNKLQIKFADMKLSVNYKKLVNLSKEIVRK